jgi:hypothetical protein
MVRYLTTNGKSTGYGSSPPFALRYRRVKRTFHERVKHGWSKIHHLIDKRGYTPYTSAHIKRVLAITERANLRSLIYLMPRVRRFEGIEGVSERGKNSMRERNGCFSARIT